MRRKIGFSIIFLILVLLHQTSFTLGFYEINYRSLQSNDQKTIKLNIRQNDFRIISSYITPEFPDENENITFHTVIENFSSIRNVFIDFYYFLQNNITQKVVPAHFLAYNQTISPRAIYYSQIGSLPWGTYFYVNIDIIDSYNNSHRFGSYSFHTKAVNFRVLSIPSVGDFLQEINITLLVYNALNKDELRIFNLTIRSSALNFTKQETLRIIYDTQIITIPLELDFKYEYAASYQFTIQIEDESTGKTFYEFDFVLTLKPSYISLIIPFSIFIIAFIIFLFRNQDLFGWRYSKKYSPSQKIKGSLSPESKEGPLILYPLLITAALVYISTSSVFDNILSFFYLNPLTIVCSLIIVATSIYYSWKGGRGLANDFERNLNLRNKRNLAIVIGLIIAQFFFLYMLITNFNEYINQTPDSNQTTMLFLLALLAIPSTWYLFRNISSLIVEKRIIGNSKYSAPFQFLTFGRIFTFSFLNPIVILGLFTSVYGLGLVILYYSLFPYSLLLSLIVIIFFLGFCIQFTLHRLSYKTKITSPLPNIDVTAGQALSIELFSKKLSNLEAAVTIKSSFLSREIDSYKIDSDCNLVKINNKGWRAVVDWKTNISDSGRFIIRVEERGFVRKTYEQSIYVNPAVNIFTVKEFFEKADFQNLKALDQDTLLLREYPPGSRDYGITVAYGTTKSLNGADISEIIMKVNSFLEYEGEDNVKVLFLIIQEDISQSAHHRIMQLILDEKVFIITLNFSTILESLKKRNSYDIIFQELNAIFGEKDYFDYRRPVADPESYFGREKMLAEMYMDLLDEESLGLFGIRKIGKTSSIYQLMRRNPNIFWVYLNLEVFSDLEIKESLTLIYNECIRTLDTNRIRIPEDLKRLEFDKIAFLMEALGLLKNYIMETGLYVKFVIVVDEIDYLLLEGHKKGLDGYYEILRFFRLITEAPYNIPVIVVGLDASLNRRYDLPTFEFFKERWLKNVDSSSAIKMIDKFSGLMKMNFSEDGKAFLMKEASTHPFVLRQVSSKIFHIRENINDEINNDMVNKGIERYLDESTYFKQIWENSISEEDRLLLLEFLTNPKFIQEKLNDPNLKHLIQLGLLERGDNDQLRISIPIFERWIKEERLGI